jgi:hypothetical protein
MDDEPKAENPLDNGNILKEKPKRKQTLTDEQRAQKADHMRKISLARIEKARLANESKLNEEEKKVIEKLAKVEDKKQQIRKIKETTPPEKNLRQGPEKKLKPKASKKIVIQEDSTDSEDYYDDDGSSSDDEIIYVAKKPTKKAQDKSIIKPKRETKDKEVTQEVPKTIIKFL